MHRRYLWTGVFLIMIVIVTSSTTTASAQSSDKESNTNPDAEKFDFGLIGDFPYTPENKLEARNLLKELNSEELAFIVHDGDIKSGSSACADEVYSRELERFEGSDNPLIYTPGDNEWTDCHRTPNPSPQEADPLNRLALLRDTFFTTDESLGEETIPLERQNEEYPENARWHYGDVTFATAHVVGSNNNRPTEKLPNIGNEAEWRARNEANLVWLSETFDEAKRRNSAGVTLTI